MALSQGNSPQTWRIVDASLNRVGEGLRLLENIARLLLDDTVLTEQLKTMRHDLIRGDTAFHRQLLQARNSAADVGRDIDVPGEEKERGLPLVLVANARRVQESLRTLEELAKVPGVLPQLDPEKFKHARFHLYTLEKELLFRLLRRDKLERLKGLYVIIDLQILQERQPVEVARQVINGGAGTIQLRDKLLSKKELLLIAQQLKNLCAERGVLFIMNDYLDLALETDADGLHVGQDDLPVSVARKLLPMDKILGVSARTAEQVAAARAEGADYLGVGAMYPTATKEKAVVVGLERLRQLRQLTSLPLVAIGGINWHNASAVMAAGADAVAVVSAIIAAGFPAEASRQIVSVIEAEN